MKKILILMALLVAGSFAFAKQYVLNGIYLLHCTDKVADNCRELINKGYHIDFVCIDDKTGRYLVIYSDGR